MNISEEKKKFDEESEMVCHIACQAECQSFSFKEKREERPLCDKCAEECDTKMKGLDHKKTVHVFKYALTGKLLIVFILYLLTDCQRFSGWE